MGFMAILFAVWLVTALLAGGLCAAAARGDRILHAQLTDARLEAGAMPVELVSAIS
jgi:hypothetical protein